MSGRRGNSGAAALHVVLRDSNLLEYEPLLLEEGAYVGPVGTDGGAWFVRGTVLDRYYVRTGNDGIYVELPCHGHSHPYTGFSSQH